MPPSQYTPEQKAEALDLYRDHGACEAARRTGIARATISQWARRAGVTRDQAENNMAAAVQAATLTAAEKRIRLREELLDKARELLARMDQPHQEFVGVKGNEVRYERAPAAAVKAYATSVGILIDKLRLEEGKATSREEHVQVDELDRDIEQLLAVMADRDHGRDRAAA